MIVIDAINTSKNGEKMKNNKIRMNDFTKRTGVSL